MGVCQLTICEVITLSTVLSICNVGIPVGSLPRFKVHKHQGLQTHHQLHLPGQGRVTGKCHLGRCSQGVVRVCGKAIAREFTNCEIMG